MILLGLFKLTEAKCIGAKATVGINGDRLNHSCDPCGGNQNETSRHRWLVPMISLGGHGD